VEEIQKKAKVDLDPTFFPDRNLGATPEGGQKNPL
jgi:hypothetical protein